MKNHAILMGMLLAIGIIGLNGCSEAMGPDKALEADEALSADAQSAELQTAEQALFGFGCWDSDWHDNLHFARTTDNKCIAYRSYGTGNQNVILVHGWGGWGVVSIIFLTGLDCWNSAVRWPVFRGSGGRIRRAAGISRVNYKPEA